MPLTDFAPIGFIPTRDAAAARAFYEDPLGLRLESDDPFALVFRLGSVPGIMLRVFRVPEFTPSHFTVFGWEVAELEETIDELSDKGVTFLRYGYFEQDERGIWTAPGGSRIAWFSDPDGNTLSLSKHVR